METDSIYAEEIKKKIDALPPDIKALVYSVDMASIIQEIGKKNNLHIDQTGALEAEAAAVMIGITKPEEFVQNVADALSINEQKSAAVVKDVNDMLFVKIQNSMKKGAPPVSPIPPPAMPPVPPAAPVPVAPAAPPAPQPPPPTPPPSTSSQPAQNATAGTAGQAKPPLYKVDPYREPPE